MISSPTTAPLQVFVPFFRKKLGLEDFREILQETCNVVSVVVNTKILRFPDGRVDLSRLHYYAFLTVVPTSLTKMGRNLAKNLLNRVSTFVYYDGGCFLELKPFMTVQQRLDRGYCVAPCEEEKEHYDDDVDDPLPPLLEIIPVSKLESQKLDGKRSIFDSEVERDWLIREYDDLIREIYKSVL